MQKPQESLHSPTSKPKVGSWKEAAKIFLAGMCMGAADIVPGISGGTIAFILGIYGNFIDSIKSINTQSFKTLLAFKIRSFFKSVAWEFLSCLIFGIAVSFLSLAHVFTFVLSHEIYRIFLYSAFLGLVFASAVFCAKQIQHWRFKHLVALAIGALTAFTLTTVEWKHPSEALYSAPIQLFPTPTTPIKNFDAANHRLTDISAATLGAMLAKGTITPETPIIDQTTRKTHSASEIALPYSAKIIDPWLICCGAIGISAMLLPGISGSYLLTVLGVYPSVIRALTDFTHSLKNYQFDHEAFNILFNMAIGIIIGGLFFSRAVSWLLQRHHNISIATLIGFMVGTIRSLWPFWTYSYSLNPLKLDKGPQLEVIQPFIPPLNSPTLWISLAWIVAGAAAVFILEALAHRKTATASAR